MCERVFLGISLRQAPGVDTHRSERGRRCICGCYNSRPCRWRERKLAHGGVRVSRLWPAKHVVALVTRSHVGKREFMVSRGEAVRGSRLASGRVQADVKLWVRSRLLGVGGLCVGDEVVLRRQCNAGVGSKGKSTRRKYFTAAAAAARACRQPRVAGRG